jgi:hypothetical protein
MIINMQMKLSLGIDMRVKSIVITSLVLTSLLVLCMAPGYAMELSQPKIKPLFDMSSSAWTLDTYPAFTNTGTSLYNAQTPKIPTTSGTDMGQISGVNYSPIFDMSPNSWTFNSYPAFRSGNAGSSLFGKLFS